MNNQELLGWVESLNEPAATEVLNWLATWRPAVLKAARVAFELSTNRRTNFANHRENRLNRVVRCVCGYGPTDEADLDEHILASMHLPGDHTEKR